MSSDTVTIDGIEFDTNDLLAAIEEAKDEETGYTYGNRAIAGSVVVEGDGDHDTFVRVANVKDVDSLPIRYGVSSDDDYVFGTTRSIRRRVEEKTEPTIEEAVREIMGDLPHHFGDKYPDHGDAYVCFQGDNVDGESMEAIPTITNDDLPDGWSICAIRGGIDGTHEDRTVLYFEQDE